jgi:hypothetical protein
MFHKMGNWQGSIHFLRGDADQVDYAL